MISLVNEVILRALNMRASDIHVNPEKDHMRIRFRVDGILQEILSIPKELQQAIISRLKIMAAMDIAERRAPQDGRISLFTPVGEFDFRVSSYPAIHGENIVIRILDKRSARIGLEKLGLEDRLRQQVETLIHRPYGMILVGGPTGAGKTTTLYACLNALNAPERNIMTIEDPVEYQLPGIIQANVNAKAGITFASGLRALVRQDPDVILVGEIRDQETARIAIEASLTGHLVLSTIHANDSAGAITRLIDMGIEPFLVASALVASLSQRLLRLNCTRCSAPYAPSPAVLERLGMPLQASHTALLFQRGEGCESCHRSGYRGRIGIYELLEITPEIQSRILERATNHELRRMALSGHTLLDDALRKLRAGQTTPEEVMRVTIL
jgi:type IV pilus assembly protein PilB